jgi:hypothetical protein
MNVLRGPLNDPLKTFIAGLSNTRVLDGRVSNLVFRFYLKILWRKPAF